MAVDPISNEWYNTVQGQPDRNHERQFVELTASSYEYCYANPVRFNDPSGEQPPGSRIVVGYPQGTVPSSTVQRAATPTVTIAQAPLSADELLNKTRQQYGTTLDQLARKDANLKGALDVIIKNYQLDKIAPNFKIRYDNNEERRHGAFETSGEIGELQRLNISKGDLYLALGDGLSTFVLALTHEYIHAFQKGVAHTPTIHEEREFLAQQFSVFPNASIVSREGTIDFHGVSFPEPANNMATLWSARALGYYAHARVNDEFRQMYRDDAIKLVNKFNESYNSLPENYHSNDTYKQYKEDVDKISDKYNLR